MSAARINGPADGLEAQVRWLVCVRGALSVLAFATLIALDRVFSNKDIDIALRMCAAEIVASLAWWSWLRARRLLGLLMHAGLLLDLAVVTVGVVATGRAESPLLPLYVLVSTGAGLINPRGVFVYSALSGACLASLMLSLHLHSEQGVFQLQRVTGIAATTWIILGSSALVLHLLLQRAQSERDALHHLTEERGHRRDDFDAHQAEQRQLNSDLKESLQSRAQFLALMSHELRTPLNSIIGFSELLLQRDINVSDEERRRFLEHIGGGGRRLLSIIDQIIDLSRLSAGTLELRAEPLHASQATRDAADAVRDIAVARKIVIETVTADGLPAAVADARRVRQVLVALLENAIRFSPPEANVRALAERSGEEVCIRITDHGPGIPTEHIRQVFEPFHQVDSSTRRKHEGPGLGLAMARTLAEAMGGRIEVESEVGKGTTMSLFLPTSVQNAGSATPG
ncbi:MAG: sensor histidine kinase [Proteobacteria bacterium]|nr:sensor histidine kinase [Pseudomonadota bacterium]